MVTFTTLGHEWRLLSSIQPMNGILLFGWTTALLFSVLQRTWILEPPLGVSLLIVTLSRPAVGCKQRLDSSPDFSPSFG